MWYMEKCYTLSLKACPRNSKLQLSPTYPTPFKSRYAELPLSTFPFPPFEEGALDKEKLRIETEQYDKRRKDSGEQGGFEVMLDISKYDSHDK